MLDYIFILIAAVIVFPIFLFLIAKGVVGKSSLRIVLSGMSIAVIGLFIQQNYSFYYTVLVMIGLIFSITVLLDKRKERDEAVNDELLVKEKKAMMIDEPQKSYAMEEAAATIEVQDEFTLIPLEDDLDHWMAAEQKEVKADRTEQEERE